MGRLHDSIKNATQICQHQRGENTSWGVSNKVTEHYNHCENVYLKFKPLQNNDTCFVDIRVCSKDVVTEAGRTRTVAGRGRR